MFGEEVYRREGSVWANIRLTDAKQRAVESGSWETVGVGEDTAVDTLAEAWIDLDGLRQGQYHTNIVIDSNETHVLALPLSIQCFEGRIERMLFRDIDHVVTPGVPPLLVISEILMIRCHSIQETRRVNER